MFAHDLMCEKELFIGHDATINTGCTYKVISYGAGAGIWTRVCRVQSNHSTIWAIIHWQDYTFTLLAKPTFVVRSTQRLVEIFNICLFWCWSNFFTSNYYWPFSNILLNIVQLRHLLTVGLSLLREVPLVHLVTSWIKQWVHLWS